MGWIGEKKTSGESAEGGFEMEAEFPKLFS